MGYTQEPPGMSLKREASALSDAYELQTASAAGVKTLPMEARAKQFPSVCTAEILRRTLVDRRAACNFSSEFVNFPSWTMEDCFHWARGRVDKFIGKIMALGPLVPCFFLSQGAYKTILLSLSYIHHAIGKTRVHKYWFLTEIYTEKENT